MRWLFALFALAPADMVPVVSVEAAYAIASKPTPGPAPAPAPGPAGCVGGCKCDNGLLVHGDGHRTRCKCPSTCPCQKGFPN